VLTDVCNYLVGKHAGNIHLEDEVVDGRTVLKGFLKKSDELHFSPSG
jgi:hypothetical protein